MPTINTSIAMVGTLRFAHPTGARNDTEFTTAVIPRAGWASSTPRPVGLVTDVSDYWIARPSAQWRTRRAMTNEGCESAFSRRDGSELCVNFRPPWQSRAQGKPGARCTRGLVCNLCERKRTRAYRSSGGNPAFTARWFYGLLRALPGDRLVATVICGILPANLAPAPGRQDHTTSPSAISCARQAHHRVHRIPPRVRDVAQRPSCRVRRASW